MDIAFNVSNSEHADGRYLMTGKSVEIASPEGYSPR